MYLRLERASEWGTHAFRLGSVVDHRDDVTETMSACVKLSSELRRQRQILSVTAWCPE